MFPTPIQKYSIPVNIFYRVALIVTLFIWLMPLIAVMLTSIRTYDDILAGNIGVGQKTLQQLKIIQQFLKTGGWRDIF